MPLGWFLLINRGIILISLAHLLRLVVFNLLFRLKQKIAKKITFCVESFRQFKEFKNFHRLPSTIISGPAHPPVTLPSQSSVCPFTALK